MSGLIMLYMDKDANRFAEKSTKISGYANMKSITKLFTSVAIANLVNLGKIQYNDPIIKFFPGYKYNKITILDILHHTSGIENTWSYYDAKKNRYIMSDIQKKYSRAKDRCKFVLSLDQTSEYGKFNYNNYTYDLLAIIVKIISGQNIAQYMKKLFFDKYDISFTWGKNNNQYFGGFGLYIKMSCLRQLPNLLTLMKKINYGLTLETFTLDGIKYDGHSGSGGQYLYYCLDRNIFFCIISGKDPDSKPKIDQISFKQMKKYLKSFSIP